MAKKSNLKKNNNQIYLYDIGGILKGVGSVGNIIGVGVSNAKIGNTTGIESSINSAKSYVVGANNNDSLMNEWGTFSPVNKIGSWKDIRGGSTGERITNTLGAIGSGAMAGSKIMPGIGTIIGAGAGLVSGVSGWLSGNQKAKNKALELNRQIEEANASTLLALSDKAEMIDKQNDLMAMANFSANGGYLFKNGGDTKRANFKTYKPIYDRKFYPEFLEQLQDSLVNRGWAAPQKSAILSAILHESGGDPTAVDKSGKYKGIAQWGPDRYPNTTDLGEQIHHLLEEATHATSPGWSDGGGGIPYIGTLKEGYDKFWNATDPYEAALYYNKGNIRPADPKARINRAEEAVNIFNHMKSDGGFINNQHGGIFSNGIVTIGNGGTHEQNPFEGVQLGSDPQGIPNMVEEGEIIWNDYVFSNRLEVPKTFKDVYKVKGTTFAEVAKEFQKESEERPNDPISKNGLDNFMSKLQSEQELIRAKKEMKSKNNKNKFEDGGPVGEYEEIIDALGTLKPIGITTAAVKPQDFAPIVKPKLSGRSTDFDNTLLRYAPVVGSGLGVVENLFSKPDYSGAKTIIDASNRVGNYSPVSYSPIGTYLSYNPFDTSYYTNKLGAQAAATRRAIINQSAGNRGVANAGILAADYNAQTQLGDLFKKAEEYNLAQKQQVADFNRNTNMANAEMGLQASRYNQAARQAAEEARLKGITQAVGMMDAIDQQRAASRSANISGLFNNLGNVGIDYANRADLYRMADAGLFGTLPDEWMEYLKPRANGGKIRKKNKKGLTY